MYFLNYSLCECYKKIPETTYLVFSRYFQTDWKKLGPSALSQLSGYQSNIYELGIEETSKMAMEAAPTSPQLTNYAPQNTATVTHTVPASVNLIQPDQGKSLYIVDPSQQHALQMFGSPDQRTFMANPVEFNPAAGTITTTAVSNGNGQITMVSIIKMACNTQQGLQSNSIQVQIRSWRENVVFVFDLSKDADLIHYCCASVWALNGVNSSPKMRTNLRINGFS